MSYKSYQVAICTHPEDLIDDVGQATAAQTPAVLTGKLAAAEVVHGSRFSVACIKKHLVEIQEQALPAVPQDDSVCQLSVKIQYGKRSCSLATLACYHTNQCP